MLTVEEYQAKRQARYERLKAAAERASKEGKAATDQAHEMASVIPFGQPILVGHHSESRDRNYRGRIESKYRRGYELHKKSQELLSRAEAIKQNTSIFTDDPEALEKLEDKIALLEARQERMKAANRLIKKKDRDGLLDLGFTDAQIERLMEPDVMGAIGYPRYAISNNNANLNRYKKRLKQVAEQQSIPDKDETIGNVKVEWRASENRIRVFFPGRVDYDLYKKLKRYGFRSLRSSGEGAFSANYTNNAAYFVKELRDQEKGGQSNG